MHDSCAACHVPDAVDRHHFGTGLVWDGVGPRRLICRCLSGFFVARPVSSQSRWIGSNLAGCLGDEIFLGTDTGTSWESQQDLSGTGFSVCWLPAARGGRHSQHPWWMSFPFSWTRT